MPIKHLGVAQRVRLWGLSLCVALAGCGGNPATVTGVVTMDDKPLERGNVGFNPAAGGLKAVGSINSDGTYELSTNRESGLQTGEYKVTVVSNEPGEPDPNGGPPMPGKSLIPRRYGRTNTSELSYSVEKGSNTIDIKLTSEGLEEGNKAKKPRR